MFSSRGANWPREERTYARMPSHRNGIGQRVNVYWERDATWYSGRVVSHTSTRGWRIEYDTVEGEDDLAAWHDLTEERHEWLDDGGTCVAMPASSSAAAKKRPRAEPSKAAPSKAVSKAAQKRMAPSEAVVVRDEHAASPEGAVVKPEEEPPAWPDGAVVKPEEEPPAWPEGAVVKPEEEPPAWPEGAVVKPEEAPRTWSRAAAAAAATMGGNVAEQEGVLARVLANVDVLPFILRHLAPIDVGRLDRAAPSLHRVEEGMDSVMNVAARVILSEMLASGYKDEPLPAAVATNETPLRRLARLSDLRVAPHDFYCRIQEHCGSYPWRWEPAAIEKAYAAVGPLGEAALGRLVLTTTMFAHYQGTLDQLFLHHVDAALVVCFAPPAPSRLLEDITDDESEYEAASTESEVEDEECAESDDEDNWTDPDDERERLQQEEEFNEDLYPVQDIGLKTRGTVWHPQGRPMYVKTPADSNNPPEWVAQFRCTLMFRSGRRVFRSGRHEEADELPPRAMSLTTWAENKVGGAEFCEGNYAYTRLHMLPEAERPQVTPP